MKNTPLIRLAIMFAWIPVAFLVGVIAHSQNAFVVVMAIGLVSNVLLRLVERSNRRADDDDPGLVEYRERLRRLTKPRDDTDPPD